MEQLSLFDDFATRLGGLDAAIATAMHRAFSGCGLSKDEVIDKMNAEAVRARVKLTKGNAKELTVSTFEKWLSASEQHHLPPTRAINIFCKVVNDLTPIRVQLIVHSADIMTATQKTLCDIGETYIATKKTRKRMKDLEDSL
ncbi:MAG: hypothetical protein BA863_03490 [Desulfovibrio sp. S3730MH75]|nr:MAG: hypothetical protein BA863_03490 [Desulfovibrio sp. S3730MH75]